MLRHNANFVNLRFLHCLNSKNFKIPLIVGRRIAQIIFFDTEGIINQSYTNNGKYQNKDSIIELKKLWKHTSIFEHFNLLKRILCLIMIHIDEIEKY
jgi:hypothetical protein